MANEKINEYLSSTITPDPLSEFDMDHWTGSAFVSTRITFGALQTALGSGNLGTNNLTQTDPTRTYTFSGNEVSNILIFRNLALNQSLTINAQCDVYNHGLGGIATNTLFGLDTGRALTGGNNSSFGVNALKDMITGVDNVAVGFNAGRFITGGAIDNLAGLQSIYIGSGTQAKADGEANQIVIGFGAVGNGANTVTIGNGNITKNHFSGTICATDFIGVGERNIVTDALGCLKIGTTLGLLSRFATLGSFPNPGDIERIYVANDTDFMYLWDVDSLQYKKIGNEGIYTFDSSFSDDIRLAKLKQDSASSHFTLANASGNAILRVDGLRNLYLDALQAPAGLTHGLTIDDQGLVSSGLGNNIYDSDGTLLADRLVTGGGKNLTFSGVGVFAVLSTTGVGFSNSTSGDVNFTNLGSGQINLTTVSGNLNLSSGSGNWVVAGAGSGFLTATTGITIASSGANVSIQGLAYPNADATVNFVLKTDGAGVLGFVDVNTLISLGGTGIYGGDGALTGPTVITMTTANTLHFNDGYTKFTSSTTDTGANILLVEDNTNADIFTVNDDMTGIFGKYLGVKDNRTTFQINGNANNSVANAIGLHVKANVDVGTNSDVCLIEHANPAGGSPNVTCSVLRVMGGHNKVTPNLQFGLKVSSHPYTSIGVDITNNVQLRVSHIMRDDTTPPNGTVTAHFENLVSVTSTDADDKFGVKITSTGTFVDTDGPDAINTGLLITVGGADINYALITTGGDIGLSKAAPTARLHVKGVGADASTFGLKVENSSGTATLEVDNAGGLFVTDATISGISGAGSRPVKADASGKLSSVVGFTGSGVFTTFTIVDGIITAAS